MTSIIHHRAAHLASEFCIVSLFDKKSSLRVPWDWNVSNTPRPTPEPLVESGVALGWLNELLYPATPPFHAEEKVGMGLCLALGMHSFV